MDVKTAVVVGAGGMGTAWAGNLVRDPRTRLVGWADLDEDRLKFGSETLESGPPALSTDFVSLLRELEPDFVVDATPPDVHRDVVVTALGLGFPVLGEKPMAESLESARDMVRAAEGSGKLYMVSQSRRYNAALELFRDTARALGTIGILGADFYIGPHFGGFRDEMESPLLADMAIHTFDAARFVLGTDAESVVCDEFNPGWSWYQGNAAAHAMFTMAGGARFAYRGAWCAEGRPTSWESSWRAVCSGGSATWDGHEQVSAGQVVGEDGFLRPVEETVSTAAPAKYAAGIEGSLQEFLDALETGSVPHGECHDNFKSLAMVHSAIESARRGVRVRVPAD